jgi:hypothetical protein
VSLRVHFHFEYHTIILLKLLSNKRHVLRYPLSSWDISWTADVCSINLEVPCCLVTRSFIVDDANVRHWTRSEPIQSISHLHLLLKHPHEPSSYGNTLIHSLSWVHCTEDSVRLTPSFCSPQSNILSLMALHRYTDIIIILIITRHLSFLSLFPFTSY